MQYLSDRKEEGQKEDRRAKEKEDTDHIHSLPGLQQLSNWPDTNAIISQKENS